MGTLFTMDSRYDAAGPPENKFHRCTHSYSLFSPSKDTFEHQQFEPNGISEAWELVIVGVQKKDSGDYHCRLTGNMPQSLVYHLTVKKFVPEAIISPKNFIALFTKIEDIEFWHFQTSIALIDPFLLRNTSTYSIYQTVTVNAPRYVRRYESATFACSMEASHGDFSQIIVDWYRVTPGQKGVDGHRLIETQEWNNISVYKEILSDSKSGLRLNAVMQIHSTDYQHEGIYECQAHQITHNKRPRVYDSIAVAYTGWFIFYLNS
ncbi:unnamed protein product [Rodentolepis nana]|uniref:Ig-like domain-containing protein n=1 Tax=Rodentolepis nana TaxID=102285 RepID=A0A0R3TQA0_RODNA|nr:unnamed protein product [Rodentolepis nana]